MRNLLREHKSLVHMSILLVIVCDFYHSGFNMADASFLLLSVMIEIGF